ncbi:zinc finger protein 502-like isoform X2 [Actinia tenebrosa]|uniref:Zinc finger protein 502-like isoform X1 n=1 Tax=Actinia tenebrosa TaxID=6105 RepID=A0A6P8I3F8_ACTTE|nr:zinc finger protein 502-like isoform X1 [Actinia tenebrosa]XP_031559438.1 zinc finger protein 502-like isoform X2 [Actinia tenebrosa]
MADESSEPLPQSQGHSVANSSDDEVDIHVCGRCKESFTDLTAYIEHKKSKLCQKSREKSHPVIPINLPHDHASQHVEVQLSSPQGETVGSDTNERLERKTLIITDDTEGNKCTNKVVVELLDPVDVHMVTGQEDNTQTEQVELRQEQITVATPKKRHKRKNSTPKTTRKSKSTPPPGETTQSNEEEDCTVTVHIPESQLVHLGGEGSGNEAIMTKGARKQEATSVFVPIYLTNSKRIYKCNKCPAEFRTKEERGEHTGMHKKHFKCSDCSKRYYTPESLENHRATETHVHTCDQCNKVFHSQIYLRRHKAIHIVERNFSCDVCSKAFTSVANCRAHKRSVHAVVKKHVCEECGKAFSRKDKLKRHQLIHIPYANRPVFPCPFRSHTGCTSTFYREDKLKRHLFTHSKEKPYKCEKCEKGFARRDNLNDHIKTHTKEFSYICPTCERGFLGPAKLKKHLRTVHPEIEYDMDAICQKTTDMPTMATMATMTVDTQTEEPTSQEKALINETQITVGLAVVNEAISAGTHFESPTREDITSDEDVEESEPCASETIQSEAEQLIRAPAHSLPPAPPLIHHQSLSTHTAQLIPSGSVFIPRVNLEPGTYNRDMVTIPNELLSMVHGLNT